MEELKKEKKVKKLKEEEFLEPKIDEIVEKPASKAKKQYRVILATPSKVVYEVKDGCLSFTANIWGNIKEGDLISI
jgi:hypothetical protein